MGGGVIVLADAAATAHILHESSVVSVSSGGVFHSLGLHHLPFEKQNKKINQNLKVLLSSATHLLSF